MTVQTGFCPSPPPPWPTHPTTARKLLKLLVPSSYLHFFILSDLPHCLVALTSYSKIWRIPTYCQPVPTVQLTVMLHNLPKGLMKKQVSKQLQRYILCSRETRDTGVGGAYWRHISSLQELKLDFWLILFGEIHHCDSALSIDIPFCQPFPC